MKLKRCIALCAGLMMFMIIASGAAMAATAKKPLSGVTIGIDPGHQQKSISAKEPNAPDSTTMKAGVSSGTRGRTTKVYEYVINLQVALLLQKMLEDEGATVVMTRTTNDVSITNVERAELMNKKKVNLAVRIHANGNNNPEVNGAFILIPTGKYTKAIEKESKAAAQVVLEAFIAETGAKNRGLQPRSDQTGFNWSKVPIINIEMGYMTNPTEDVLLISPEYQEKCARGLCNGIVNYFAGKK